MSSTRSTTSERRGPQSSRMRRAPSTEASRASLIQPPPQVRTKPQYMSHEAANQIASDPDQPFEFWFVDSALGRVNAFLDQIIFSVLDTARSPTFQRINLAAEAFLKSKLYLEAAAAAEQDLADFVDPEDRDHIMSIQEKEPSEPFDLEVVFKKARIRVMTFMRFSDLEGDTEDQYLDDEQFLENSDYVMNSNMRWSKARGNQVSELTSLFLCAMLEYIAELCIIAAARAAVERHDTTSRSSEDEGSEPHDPNAPLDEDYEEREELEISIKDVEKITLDYTVGRLWRTWKTAIRPSRAFNNARRSLQFGRSGRPISLGTPRSINGTPDEQAYQNEPSAPPPRAHRSSSLPGQFTAVGDDVDKVENKQHDAAKRQSEPPKGRSPRSSFLGLVFPKDKLPPSPRRRSFCDIYPGPGQRKIIIPLVETKKRSRSMSESEKELESLRREFSGLRLSKPATIGPKLNTMRPPAEMRIAIPNNKRNSIPAEGRYARALTPDTSAAQLELESPHSVPSPPSSSRLSMQHLRQRAARESMRSRHSAKNSNDLTLRQQSGRLTRTSTNPSSVGIGESHHEASEYSTPLTDKSPALLEQYPHDQRKSMVSEQSLDRSMSMRTHETRPSSDEGVPASSPTASSRASIATSILERKNSDSKTSFESRRDISKRYSDDSKGSSLEVRVDQPERISENDEPPSDAEHLERLEKRDHVRKLQEMPQDEADVEEVDEADEAEIQNATMQKLHRQSATSAGQVERSAGAKAPAERPIPPRLQMVENDASRFIEGSPVAARSPDSRTISPLSGPGLARRGETASVASDAQSREVSMSGRESSLRREGSLRRGGYVDETVGERASLRRISGPAISARKMEAFTRSRHPSVSSISNKPRDGAHSRQSHASSNPHSEIVEREFDDLISGAETQKFTLTPPNLRDLGTPATPRFHVARQANKAVAPPAAAAYLEESAVQPIEEEDTSYNAPYSASSYSSMPIPRTIPTTVPESYTARKPPGPIKTAAEKTAEYNAQLDREEEARRIQLERENPVVSTTPKVSQDEGSPVVTSNRRESEARANTGRARGGSDTKKPSFPQRMLGRDPVPGAEKSTRDLARFFNESRLPGSGYTTPKATGRFTPLVPASPAMSPRKATFGEPGPAQTSASRAVPHQGALLQARDPNVRGTVPNEFLSAIREGPPGASGGAGAAQAPPPAANPRSNSAASGSVVGSMAGSSSSSSYLLQQSRERERAAASKRRVNKDIYSTDFVDEDDEDTLMDLVGALPNPRPVARPEREETNESFLDFLKGGPQQLSPATTATQSTINYSTASARTETEKKPSRLASFASFRSRNSSRKGSTISTEAPQLPTLMQLETERTESATPSGYVTPTERNSGTSFRSSGSRTAKPSTSLWRRLAV